MAFFAVRKSLFFTVMIFLLGSIVPVFSQEIIATFGIGGKFLNYHDDTMDLDILHSSYDPTVTKALSLSVNVFFVGNFGITVATGIELFPVADGSNSIQPLVGLGYIYSGNTFYIGGILNYCYEPDIRLWFSTGFYRGDSFLVPTVVGGYDLGPFSLIGQLSYMYGIESSISGFRFSFGVGVRIGKK